MVLDLSLINAVEDVTKDQIKALIETIRSNPKNCSKMNGEIVEMVRVISEAKLGLEKKYEELLIQMEQYKEILEKSAVIAKDKAARYPQTENDSPNEVDVLLVDVEKITILDYGEERECDVEMVQPIVLKNPEKYDSNDKENESMNSTGGLKMPTLSRDYNVDSD
uniref:ING domain-containing protein n=1 Tax=Rhabditophanes sp. KR3021 TaxID=114890 RepID=A0AC35TRL3_9BILA